MRETKELSTATQAQLDAFLEEAQRRLALPGLAVAVVQGDCLIYQRGLGLAGKARAATPETPFILGSVSKSFTALAVMQLVEEGELDLDQPIVHYLPWFAMADSQGRDITIQQLLLHTSGISRYTGRELLSQRHDIGMEKAVRALSSVKLAHKPGSTYEYSNTNYLILSLLIELISGESYEQYIQRYIFNPLSMKKSFTSVQAAAGAGLASGYQWWYGRPVRTQAPFLRDALGAAFLISSAGDMARWLQLHLCGQVDGAAILSQESLAELHRPQAQTHKLGIQSAFGWRVSQLGGETMWHHGGEVSNFRSDMLLFPDRQLGLIVLANCNHGLVAQLGLDQIAPDLARLLLGQPRSHERLAIRAFGLRSAAASLGLVALAICLWLVLASMAVASPGGLVVLALTALVPGLTLWRVPRLADMPWRGLRLYAPDLAYLVQWLSIASLVIAGTTLLRWLL